MAEKKDPVSLIAPAVNPPGVIASGTGSVSPRQGHPQNETACYAVVRKDKNGGGEEWVDLGTLNWDRRGTEALNEDFERHVGRTAPGRYYLNSNPLVRIGAFRLIEMKP